MKSNCSAPQNSLSRPVKGAYHFHFGNLTAGDIVFLSGLARIMCDPAQRQNLDALRDGRVGLLRDDNHKCRVVPVDKIGLGQIVLCPSNRQ